MTTLDIEFENSNGKEQHLRLKDFSMRNSAAELKATLEKFTLLNLFEKDGVGLYKKLKHATIIEEIESPIFDTEADEEAPVLDAQLSKEEALPQVEEPAEELNEINIPEDLVITEEKPDPGILIQTIGLPEGITPSELTESQAMIIISACMPAGARLEDIKIENKASPVKLVLTERIIEEESPPVITQTPPEKVKRKRTRLLDRIRKRE
ncbi:DUF2922 family protein, partial [Enterococcus hulanensis]|nr:DUF2922 family protein [Enterococcus hulanensis]MDT2599841.1 DUF2922 family protein [Enterococcus hulanensis]MDT2609303.1 DUF2922 family protein [Enterococcus hulanensis]MDT2615880.1 DUF2922 family protein [Enterococcus hulanensis]MDT2628080.1 DUF2922 family protein [Enterococcus hulanensis]MDT2655185.1 DUF2922 family protein [Enterococcus hulanensis]